MNEPDQPPAGFQPVPVFCPKCHNGLVPKFPQRFEPGETVRCPACFEVFTVEKKHFEP